MRPHPSAKTRKAHETVFLLLVDNGLWIPNHAINYRDKLDLCEPLVQLILAYKSQIFFTDLLQSIPNIYYFIFSVKPGPKKTLNIVTVGDGDTGKTSLLMSFKGRPFTGEYLPTVFDTYTRDIRIEGETIELGLWDTAGQEGYDRLRPLAYPHCDCFVICYAVDNPDSLYNVKEKWLPELEHFCPNVPKILVATKKDIRRRTLAIMDILNGNKAPSIVSYEEGLCTAAVIGASRFLETSALCNDGVREVFEQTARVALEARAKKNDVKARKKNESCCIL